MKPASTRASQWIMTLTLISAVLATSCWLRPGLAQSVTDAGSGAPAPDAPPPPAQVVNYDYFHDQLAPYGTWTSIAGYGRCWHPDAAISADPEWRPYYDMGQWIYSENGWFWQSNYGWGDIPFHYGNWVIISGFGWMWVPGYTWGPAWVFWREAESDGCIGWAPLPPGAVFVGGGWTFHGIHYGVDFDFGLGENYFVFVGCDHFHDGFFRMRGHEYAFHVPREQVHTFYGRSVLRNDFRRDKEGRLVNDGVGRDRIEHLTQRREEVTHFQERNPQVRVIAPEIRPAAESHEAREVTSKVYRPPLEEQRMAPISTPKGTFLTHEKH